MADKQISDLTAATGLTDGSLFVIEQSGAAKSANWGMIKEYISPSIAPTYSNTSKYAVGNYVIYNGKLYRCITAINSGESWDSAKWVSVYLCRDISGVVSEISSETYNLFNVNDVTIGINYTGASTPARALGGDMYSADASITVQAVSLPANLKYEIDIYSSSALSSWVEWYPGSWITDENVHTTYGVQSTNKHFRIHFGSVDNNALTEADFDGLEMQVNVGGVIYPYKPHLEAHDITARELAASCQNDILTITEQTDNLFDKSAVIIGVNGQGATAADRAVSADIYSTDNVAVQAVSLPSNLKYEVDIYSTDSLSSRQLWYPSTWITDEKAYTTYGLQSTYNHFRIHFASVDGNALTETDFEGLEMQVNIGGVIYKYKPHICSIDGKLRDEPVHLRIMEYNIGHYCYGQGASFDDVGLPADQYDEKVLGMKRFFAKYQPDILGLCEFWEWLDNAKTHKSDDVLFDPIFPYKHQTTQWNAMKSNYILSNYSIGSLGGTGQQYVKAEIDVNGITVGLLLVHFGLTAASRATEIANAITLMQGYENAIIMGDFNTDTQSDRTAVFGAAEGAGYTLANGGYFGWKNTWNYLAPDRPIDNIIFKGRIKLKDYQVLNDEVGDLCSDHIPTYADIVVY